MTETAIGAALRRAGVDTMQSWLWTLAQQLLKQNGMAVERAVKKFSAALIENDAINEVARVYLQQVLRDMRGESLLDGGLASAQQPVLGQTRFDTQTASAEGRQESEETRGQAMNVNQLPVASPSSARDGAGHVIDVSQRQAARPVRDPPPPHHPGHAKRGLHSITAVQSTIRIGLLFSLKTSDGESWGDIGWHELEGMDRDGTIARLVKRRCVPPVNRFKRLSEILTEKTFGEIVDEARKQNDAA